MKESKGFTEVRQEGIKRMEKMLAIRAFVIRDGEIRLQLYRLSGTSDFTGRKG